MLTTVSGSCGVGLSALSHKHNAQRVQDLQNIKIPPSILSCNIHVDTTETAMFFQEFLMSSSGSEWGGEAYVG